MSLATVYTRASMGMHSPLVTVETHISSGLPKFLIVGLAETAVKESRDRVRSALLNSEFKFPRKRITVNLAPADVPKEGGRFDLPIALGILAATEQIPLALLNEFEFTGELALSGELRAVPAILPFVLAVKRAGRRLLIPEGNADEASLVKGAEVFYAKHLLEVTGFLQKRKELFSCADRVITLSSDTQYPDFSEVKGQGHAKRALEVAASGQHSVLFMGPPGTGKTMLATRLPGLLPNLKEEEALEVAAVYSMSLKGFQHQQWMQRPFRSPHHNTSSAALVGGGRPPKPGEISLAHQGVLFLDELPEFKRAVLECLREPLESKTISISRVAHHVVFPANFQLIAAMNPCPCGYLGHHQKVCVCSEEKVNRYFHKISGPLLDRIDLQIEIPSLNAEALSQSNVVSETSEQVLQRVIAARERQIQRQGKLNALLGTNEIHCYAKLSPPGEALLNQMMHHYGFSARVYHRLMKLSLTLADLAHTEEIQEIHVSEALSYRVLDQNQGPKKL